MYPAVRRESRLLRSSGKNCRVSAGLAERPCESGGTHHLHVRGYLFRRWQTCKGITAPLVRMPQRAADRTARSGFSTGTPNLHGGAVPVIRLRRSADVPSCVRVGRGRVDRRPRRWSCVGCRWPRTARRRMSRIALPSVDAGPVTGYPQRQRRVGSQGGSRVECGRDGDRSRRRAGDGCRRGEQPGGQRERGRPAPLCPQPASAVTRSRSASGINGPLWTTLPPGSRCT
jgi:hypothetical protein